MQNDDSEQDLREDHILKVFYLSLENSALNNTPEYLQSSRLAKILKYSALESWL